MVDPHDLEACGIDSNVYTGYAFGMGVERITNLNIRVSDLRMFSENDVRFLKEFESALKHVAFAMVVCCTCSVEYCAIY